MNSPSSANQKVFGYTDRLSARPGEQLSLHVSCEGVDSYTATVVQLHHGFDGSAGPGFHETVVPTAVDGTYPGRHYVCRPGSFVEVSDPTGRLKELSGFEVRAAVFPTLPRNERAGNMGAYRISHSSVTFDGEHQAVLGTWDAETSTGWALTLEGGRPTFVWSESGQPRTLQLDIGLTAHHWYELLLEVPAGAGEVVLSCNPLRHVMDRVAPAAARLAPESATVRTAGRWASSDMPFRIGALAARADERLVATSAFNGKIGGVRIRQRDGGAEGTVARWHFGRSGRADGLVRTEVVDESANSLNGRCVNAPVRGVTGPACQGRVEDFRLAPDEFDAIHFHDDDIADAEWP